MTTSVRALIVQVGVMAAAFGVMAAEAAPDPAALLQGTLVPQLTAAHVPVRSLAPKSGARVPRCALRNSASAPKHRGGSRRAQVHTWLGAHPDLCADADAGGAGAAGRGGDAPQPVFAFVARHDARRGPHQPRQGAHARPHPQLNPLRSTPPVSSSSLGSAGR